MFGSFKTYSDFIKLTTDIHEIILVQIGISSNLFFDLAHLLLHPLQNPKCFILK